MGLDVVMIGLDEIKEQVTTDVEVAAMVKWLQENIPETHTTHIGEPSGRMSEGDRLGLYSDLHVLRGLALRFERAGASSLEGATEEDLQVETERFYDAEPPLATRFINLVNHSDCDGVYVPLPLREPVTVSGTLKLPGAQEEAVNVSIGSSEGLLDELDELGPLIALPGDRGSMSETHFEQAVAGHRWPTAAYVWGLLHWYARESVRAKTLIRFC
ncbi:MAG: hypothetical protein H7Y14_01275 [Burkholderiales bacterium]|nr:hypothetical protein [Burkholderiales bacterium]